MPNLFTGTWVIKFSLNLHSRSNNKYKIVGEEYSRRSTFKILSRVLGDREYSIKCQLPYMIQTASPNIQRLSTLLFLVGEDFRLKVPTFKVIQ